MVSLIKMYELKYITGVLITQNILNYRTCHVGCFNFLFRVMVWDFITVSLSSLKMSEQSSLYCDLFNLKGNNGLIEGQNLILASES